MLRCSIMFSVLWMSTLSSVLFYLINSSFLFLLYLSISSIFVLLLLLLSSVHHLIFLSLHFPFSFACSCTIIFMAYFRSVWERAGRRGARRKCDYVLSFSTCFVSAFFSCCGVLPPFGSSNSKTVRKEQGKIWGRECYDMLSVYGECSSIGSVFPLFPYFVCSLISCFCYSVFSRQSECWEKSEAKVRSKFNKASLYFLFLCSLLYFVVIQFLLINLKSCENIRDGGEK